MTYHYEARFQWLPLVTLPPRAALWGLPGPSPAWLSTRSIVRGPEFIHPPQGPQWGQALFQLWVKSVASARAPGLSQCSDLVFLVLCFALKNALPRFFCIGERSI